MFSFFKKPWVIILLVIIASIVAWAVFFRKEKPPAYETAVAQRGEVVREVSVTGRVEPAQSAELAFETTGTVEWAGVKVSEHVQQNQELVRIDRSKLLAQLRQAQATLVTRQQELDLARRGWDGLSPEEKAIKKAAINEAQASVTVVRAQLNKTVLVAPFAGTIIRQDAKVGEVITAGTSIITLINQDLLEIKANIPEVDIAFVKIDDPAGITLDAYGSDQKFKASVTSVDPAETIVEGVATYKTTLEFSGSDERVKPGMTANIDIISERRGNVIMIPQRAVARRNGTEFVRVLGNGVPAEQEVVTGLRGSDGMIEIVKGLDSGDQVIIFSGSQ